MKIKESIVGWGLIVLLVAAGFFLSPALANHSKDHITLDLAPKEGEVAPKALGQFIEENVLLGFELDVTPHLKYIQYVYNFGSPRDKFEIAIKFAQCSILWQSMVDWKVETEFLNTEMFQVSADRMVMGAQVYTEAAGGDPDKVLTHMLPTLRAEDTLFGPGNIMDCLVIDRAVYLDMLEQGIEELPAIPEPPPAPKNDGGVAS